MNISGVAREFCINRLINDDNGFNSFIVDACVENRIDSFKIEQSGPRRNLYLGRYDLASLSHVLINTAYPLCIVSVMYADAAGKNAMRITPSTFSGKVVVTVDFYVKYDDAGVLTDGEAWYMALEQSMINAFNGQRSFVGVPAGLSYNNELRSDQGALQRDTVNYLQAITFTLVFGVIV